MTPGRKSSLRSRRRRTKTHDLRLVSRSQVQAGLLEISLILREFQGFDTKWDKVLLSMKKIPEDRILQFLYKMRLGDSEQLKWTLALCTQEPSFSRLQVMVHRFLDQKFKDRNYAPRRDDKTSKRGRGKKKRRWQMSHSRRKT